MATITRTEVRKRGIIGKLLLIFFWLFNGLMLWWLVAAFQISGDHLNAAASEAEKAGAAIGTALGTGIIIAMWVAGAIILGLLVMLTPGKTIVTETTKD